MAKHTQTICRQQPTNCLTVFDHFVGLAFKGLKLSISVPFYFHQIFHIVERKLDIFIFESCEMIVLKEEEYKLS